MAKSAREPTIEEMAERVVVPQMLCKFGCICRNKLNGLLVHTPATIVVQTCI